MRLLKSLLPLLAFVAINASAQTAKHPTPLFKTIKAEDARLFAAYNHCDLATLGDMVSDDLEFYHDQTGLSVGKAPFLKAIKENICGKVQRKLLLDTLEVYPIKDYGAVELGIHCFTHPHDRSNLGDARFLTLWQDKDGTWKVTRVISFEHNQGLLAK